MMILLLSLLLILISPPLLYAKKEEDDNNQQQQQQEEILDSIANYECNYNTDTCRIEWQMDGECDGILDLYGCYDQDCWDCDPCQHYDWDCNGCIEANCLWCPGDGLCRSQAIEATYWKNQLFVSSSCTTANDWKQTCEVTNDDNFYKDPLYDAMKWSYKLINVEEVWKQGITGAGVHVRINDVGMDAMHPELQDRIDWNNSCTSFVSEKEGNAFHGTAVASLLAASANNDECAVGVAPNVTISACTFQENFLQQDFVDMLETQLDAVQVSQNSWGPEVCTNLNFIRTVVADEATGVCLFDKGHEYSPCEPCKGQQDRSNLNIMCMDSINEYCTYYYQNDPIACAEFLDLYISCEYHSLPDSAHQAFVRGVVEGRQGKGIIYVYAGGNSHDLGAFTNTDGFVNSRFTIAVGAVNRQGQHASYSTTGSALHVVAPGGDFDAVANNIVAKAGGGCRDIAGGTSFSSPVVSGVIALMLEVNPNLGWRDVQSILAHTSQQQPADLPKDQDDEEDDWTINGAGLHHSYKYGFGIVDALAAVKAAKNWTNAGPEQQLVWRSQNGSLAIADGDDKAVVQPTLDTIIVQSTPTFEMESVVLYLDLLHASRGDLLITLTSPSGTSSILHPSKRPENQQLQNRGNNNNATTSSPSMWKLATVRNWGENPTGQWQLSLVDEVKGHRGDCANDLFEHLYYNSNSGHYEAYTCLDVEERLHCWNGKVKQTQLISEYVDRGRNNRTAAEACCFCGGGIQVTDQNVLKSWTLIIYGHDTAWSNDNEEDGSTVNAEEDNGGNLAPPLHSTDATSPQLLQQDSINMTDVLVNTNALANTTTINTTINQTTVTTSFLLAQSTDSSSSSSNDEEAKITDSSNVGRDDEAAEETIQDLKAQIGDDEPTTAEAVVDSNIDIDLVGSNEALPLVSSAAPPLQHLQQSYSSYAPFLLLMIIQATVAVWLR